MSIAKTNSLTEITRRDVRRAIVNAGICWHGDIDEIEFLARLYDLDSMPSFDSRYPNAKRDIWQHRVNNYDWDNYWIFDDERFEILEGPDEVLLSFLAEMLHPAVRFNCEESERIVKVLNPLLAPDGWTIGETARISGRPVYGPHRENAAQHIVDAAKYSADKIDADYVHRQVRRMTSAIESDPDLAIGTAKELVETICKTILDELGETAGDLDDVPRLVKQTAKLLKLTPDDIADSAKGAETIRVLLSNLATVAHRLAEIRNLYGSGHGKHAKASGLEPRHARLAVGAAATLANFLLDTRDKRKD